ncbi:MAG: hypothetical protein ACE5PT_04005 [Gemmatimonadales bacterium]
MRIAVTASCHRLPAPPARFVEGEEPPERRLHQLGHGLAPPGGLALEPQHDGTVDIQDRRLPSHLVPLRLRRMDSEATAVQIEAIRAFSVEDRLRVAESLRAFAWQLKASVIAQRHPELSDEEVMARVREMLGCVGA